MFKVMKERCAQCLYGPNKIVSDARRKQLLRDLNKNDDFFVCHKATIADNQQIACRGDWDQRECGKVGRFAKYLNVVQFVPEPTDD